MMWFKKWYHERFASHTNDAVKAVLTADVQMSNQRKVIRIIYDGCNDDSPTCRHRNRFWFVHRRRIINRPIDSAVSCISNVHKNNTDRNANESNSAVKQHDEPLNQVDDKIAEQTFINDTRPTDIDDIYSNRTNSWASTANVHRRIDSFVTNVNEYGNGENDCGSLSKPKEQRLRTFKLSIVPEIFCNICNPKLTSIDVKKSIQSDSNRIQIQYDSNEDNADRDEWPPKSFQQIEFLQRRVRELEYFISEIETAIRINTTSLSATSSGTAEKSSTCRLCDDQPLTDWVIVSIEFQPCESISNGDHHTTVTESSNSIQYYTTSEFCDRKTIVTIHQCPSNYSLNDRRLYEHQSQSLSQHDYGKYHSHNCCAIQRLLWFVRFLDFNIQTGTPSTDTVAAEVASTAASCPSLSDPTAMRYNNSISTSIRSGYHSTDSIFFKEPMYPEFNYLLQEPSSSNKHSNVLTAQMIQNSLSSISTSNSMKSSFKTPSKCYSTESIPEYFGLNECGDIIIHVDHICEEKGFGFLVGRKKKLYCDVPYGEEVNEKPKFSLTTAVRGFFQTMSSTFFKCAGVGESINSIIFFLITIINTWLFGITNGQSNNFIKTLNMYWWVALEMFFKHHFSRNLEQRGEMTNRYKKNCFEAFVLTKTLIFLAKPN